MRRLFFIFVIGCTSERGAPVVVTPRAPLVVDAGVADVAIETAAPSSASVEGPEDPVDAGETVMTLNGPVPTALLARLARDADAIPKGTLRKSPRPDAERDRLIHTTFGGRCNLERTCGPLWGIDCQAAVDGPYFYVRPRP
ncbi:MAG TPA: hypothetical protein VGH87_16695, partial [Polyangiaceae bacterium]